jgi:hypothetical protein
MRRVRQCAALAHKEFSARTNFTPVPVRRLAFRVSAELAEQIVADYQAGSTGRQLAERYGLARSTVIALLRKHGVAVRYPRVTSSEGAEMLRLYQSGMRQVDIAEQFGRAPGNVWHVLKRLGAFDAPSSDDQVPPA